MNTLHIRALYLLLILFVTSCNNDIFVDDDSAPTASHLEVDDYGEASFKFSTEHLDYIMVNMPEFAGADGGSDDPWHDELLDDYPSFGRDDYKYKCVKYLSSGETERDNMNHVHTLYKDFQQSLGEVSRLRVWNSLVEMDFECGRDRRMTLRSYRNLSGEPVEGFVQLGYSYKDECVSFTLAPSFGPERPYRVSDVAYERGCRMKSEYDEDSVMIAVDNRGTEYMTYDFPVADHCHVYVDFAVDPALGLELDGSEGFPEVEIPTYRRTSDEISVIKGDFNGEKVPFSTERVELPGYDSALPGFVADGFSRVYSFRIPPKVGLRAKFEVSRLIIHTVGELRLKNPRDGRAMSVPVKVRVNQPWNYYMRWEKVDL